MSYTRVVKKILLGVVAMLLVLISVFATPMGIAAASIKAPSGLSFDETNVLDDLLSSTVDGKAFDIRNFPYNANSSIQIINFVEYCYSFKPNMQDNYGLYIYVYNPEGLNIDKTSKQNKIQMGTYTDSEGLHYEKFNLEFISESEDANYKGLFYKFKVVDKIGIDGKRMIERVNSNERVYNISGVELVTKGNKNATEYGFGGIYKFTGYSQGYGPDENAQSTLTCTVENLETLSLEVHHTNYRTNVSSLGAGHYNEVNTVYFSVPERVYQMYGNLQKIRAEWWEYKTKMAVVTSDNEFYNLLKQYVGTDIGEYDASVPFSLYTTYSYLAGTMGAASYMEYDWCFNKHLYTNLSMCVTANKISTMLPIVFYSQAEDIDSIFSFLYSDPVAGSVESTVLAEYLYNYSNNLGNGYIDCNGRELSKDLFEDSVDEGRTMGYNDKTIDLGDTFDLNSYDSNHSWWDKFLDYGFSWPETGEGYENVAPIYELKASDLVGKNETIAKTLLVNEDDVSDLKDFYDNAVDNNERVILFRFANTDYFCDEANVSDSEEQHSYVAQQTVFFDFDIIELTFNKDGVYHVIPVVSSPMDIINGFTPPPEEFQWWKIVVALLILILIIYLCYPAIPFIVKLVVVGIKFVIKMLILPFKILAELLKGNKKKKPKPKPKEPEIPEENQTQ